MEQSKKTREMLIEHYRQYPRMQIRDIFKFMYQSSFGCEHMVSSLNRVTDYIRKEYEQLSACEGNPVDKLDGEYSRVHLSYLTQGLCAETLSKLFCLSAKSEPDGKTQLENKLITAKKLIDEGALPFSNDDFDKALAEWKDLGYPAIHHSDEFRAIYKPSYRVIANKYVAFLPVLASIDRLLRKGSATVAIEGGSASGKTTLGKILEELYGCTVFHMDDFFLLPEQRTAERYAEIGGNVDRERFLNEVLIPLEKGEEIDYRKFNCSTMTLSSPTKIKPEKLVVIEGAYSMHPDLSDKYDLSVFLDITPELQRKRISNRNSPQMAVRFFNEWIPLEQRYFTGMSVKERCDLSVLINE